MPEQFETQQTLAILDLLFDENSVVQENHISP